jgi:hypothetical protein
MNIQQLFNELKRLSESPSSSNNKEDNIEMLIPPEKQKQIFKESSQKQHTNLSCWNAYLNHLCLEAFQEIILEELDISSKSLTIPASEELAVFWEFVNGTPIRLNDISVLLIPHETTELEQIEVPQEWIDIPSLAADYYIAFQVESEIDSLDNSEEDSFDFASIELVGVTTHQTLKQKGQYDQSKRNYCLDVRHLFSLNVMRTSQQINLQVSTPILDLPALSKNRKNDLFSILSKDSPTSPRLDVSFEEWGALFEDKAWRTELYCSKLSVPVSLTTSDSANNIVPVPVRLTRWLERNFSEGAKAGWTPDLALEFRSQNSVTRYLTEQLYRSQNEKDTIKYAESLAKIEPNNLEAINVLSNLIQKTQNPTHRWNAALVLGKIDPNHEKAAVRCYKFLDIGSQKVKLSVAIAKNQVDQTVKILVELRETFSESHKEMREFPNLGLEILDQQGNLIAEGQKAEEGLCLQLDGEMGEQFSIQIRLDDWKICENLEV